MTNRWITTVALLAGLGAAPAATAQEALDEAAAHEALEACVRAAEAGDHATARAEADRAETLFEAWMEARPEDPDPRVGLARTLSQCRIPGAAFMEQGALVGRSNALLEKALEIDPGHWGARYALALNHYFTPEFLGRTGDAIRHFEILIEQGHGAERTEMAVAYAFLGDLYLRQERPEDAREVWRKGAALFPADEGLKERLAGGDPGDAGAGEPTAAPDSTADGAAVDYTMDELVVRADAGWAMEDTRSQATLSRIDVYTAPGGTADILQVFQMLPGVTRVTEGSDLYVRGGDPAETPVLVDGARLLYPGVFETLHGGVFGILDPSVLKRAYFSSGGFSARYGNALSGVVELETDGRPSIGSWRAGANFAGAGATVRLPLGDEVGAWASVRATETSLLNALHGEDEFPEAPRALEGVVGLAAEPRPGIQLEALALAEGDRAVRTVDAIGWRGPFTSEGRTALALVGGRALFADGRGTARATASWTRRASDFAFGALDRRREDEGAGARLETEFDLSGATLRGGAEARRLAGHATGRTPTTERLHPHAPVDAYDGGRATTWHAGGWLEGELRPLPPLAIVGGARVDRLPGERGAVLDPRIAVAWREGATTFRASAGIFHQGRWRIGYDLPDGGGPAGIPRRARHLALGVEREGEPWVKVEGYVKAYDRYVTETEEELAIETGPAIVAGRAAGLDAIARWTGDERWDGWVTYSLVRAHVDLADGRTVSGDHDVTHSLTAVGRANRGPWQLGVTGRYATGAPYTGILGGRAPEDGGRLEPIYGPPNAARLDDYVRLDARVTRFVPLGGGLVVTYVEMLNLTSRPNASSVVYDAQWENPRPVESFFAERTFVAGVELQF